MLDLEELRTHKAREFFLSIGEEKNVLENYKFVEERRETNETNYQYWLNKYNNFNPSDWNSYFQIFDNYLQDEKDCYTELKNSKYYLNLK